MRPRLAAGLPFRGRLLPFICVMEGRKVQRGPNGSQGDIHRPVVFICPLWRITFANLAATFPAYWAIPIRRVPISFGPGLTPGPFCLSLFNGVRGRGVLRSSGRPKRVGASSSGPEPGLPAAYACSWPACIICSTALSPSSDVMAGAIVIWKWSSQSARSAMMGSTLSAS